MRGVPLKVPNALVNVTPAGIPGACPPVMPTTPTAPAPPAKIPRPALLNDLIAIPPASSMVGASGSPALIDGAADNGESCRTIRLSDPGPPDHTPRRPVAV